MDNEIPTREQLMASFQPYIERGVKNPFDIFGQDDEESQRISRLDTAYHEAQSGVKKSLTPEGQIRAEIDESTVFFDAGFTDTELLDEIARDWLVNVLSDADAMQNQELIALVKAKILEIEQRIKELDPSYELTDWNE